MNRPEDFWAVDSEYGDLYHEMVSRGAEIASESKVAVVGLARDCADNLRNSLLLLEELGSRFNWPRGFIYENDSEDDTQEVLFRDRPSWLTVTCDVKNRPHLTGFERSRTVALAEYRNACREWVAETTGDADFVVVLDLDADGGFSVDGVLNSLAWLEKHADAAGMGSFSLLRITEDGKEKFAHHDSWAARLNWWSDRKSVTGLGWFHQLFPPVGAPPIRMNSCFGGLAVYRAAAYLAGRYAGGDCEHVPFHRSIAESTGLSMYLNPGSRFATILQ